MKLRLGIQGFSDNPKDLSKGSTVVHGILVQLIDIISHQDNHTLVHADVGNTFLQATTKEKCYTICDDYWGEYRQCCNILELLNCSISLLAVFKY